jgi:hypothetical protein
MNDACVENAGLIFVLNFGSEGRLPKNSKVATYCREINYSGRGQPHARQLASNF